MPHSTRHTHSTEERHGAARQPRDPADGPPAGPDRPLCGGVRQCGTCHVYVDDEWAAQVGPPGDDEAEMLEALADFIEVKPTSRLSCQIHITEELDGLRVHIPKEQPGI